METGNLVSWKDRTRWVGGAIALLLTLATALPLSGRQPPASDVITLEDALRIAMRSNRDLEDARLGLESAKGAVREAWSSVFPELNITADYTRNLSVPRNFLPAVIFDPDAPPDELVPVQFGADNTWSFQVRAEQPLFEAGAFVGVGAADRYRNLQGEVVRGQALEIAARVKIAYYDVLLADEAVRLNENTVERVRKTLYETEKMHEAGMSSSYDVLRLQVELANLEPQLRRARNAVEAARRTLAVELGLEDMDGVRVAGSLADVDLGEVVAGAEAAEETVVRVADGGQALILSETPDRLTQQDALALARTQRSDLRQAELNAQLRHTELRVEQAEYLPSVRLFGSYTINAQQNGDPVFFGGDDRFRSYGRQVGVQVSVPVFGGFRRPARIQQARAALEQARTDQELLADVVENEVRTLLDQVEESRTRALAQRLARQQAQRGYEIASAQYREGISSQLEMTDAETALRQSEFNLAQAVYDYLVARARLDRALGMEPDAVADERIAFQREDGNDDE